MKTTNRIRAYPKVGISEAQHLEVMILTYAEVTRVLHGHWTGRGVSSWLLAKIPGVVILSRVSSTAIWDRHENFIMRILFNKSI